MFVTRTGKRIIVCIIDCNVAHKSHYLIVCTRCLLSLMANL
ncbi:unnamed protein product [Larinioides sclopetarius]|uniref:Uncharacterized protein n=1 Tax=Larinioides sclopetarius TaxID=280406 RepID=A0AAV2BG98_9ARAC